ncbi:MAG: hypothetical protein EHM72_05920 [Calditrichaeota bacterium]|nr:MAG: hypothetical protein EHM72_05920 [Calditrichota bacterium]
MKNNYFLIKMLSLIMFLLSSTFLLAQDWPQWQGEHRDGRASGFKAPKTWPDQLKLKWKVTVGKGDATPALVNNRIFAHVRQGNEELLLCLDAVDGKELWRWNNPAPEVTGGPASHPGPRSSPAVVQGNVFTLGVGGILTCTDAKSGKIIWQNREFTNVPQFYTGMSPLIVDNMCIVELGGKEDGIIAAFKFKTGELLWKWAGEEPTYSSPVLVTAFDTKQLAVFTDQSLVGLAVENGRLLWQIPAIGERRFYNSATPVLNGAILFMTGQGRGTQAIKIEQQGSEFVTKELWKNETLGTAFNTPILKNNRLFGIDVQSAAVFCLDAKTGEKVWADTTKYDRFGSLIDAGSVMFLQTPKSELIVFDPQADHFAPIHRYKLAETPVYAHPIIAGESIFIKEEEALSRWSIK